MASLHSGNYCHHPHYFDFGLVLEDPFIAGGSSAWFAIAAFVGSIGRDRFGSRSWPSSGIITVKVAFIVASCSSAFKSPQY